MRQRRRRAQRRCEMLRKCHNCMKRRSSPRLACPSPIVAFALVSYQGREYRPLHARFAAAFRFVRTDGRADEGARYEVFRDRPTADAMAATRRRACVPFGGRRRAGVGRFALTRLRVRSLRATECVRGSSPRTGAFALRPASLLRGLFCICAKRRAAGFGIRAPHQRPAHCLSQRPDFFALDRHSPTRPQTLACGRPARAAASLLISRNFAFDPAA